MRFPEWPEKKAGCTHWRSPLLPCAECKKEFVQMLVDKLLDGILAPLPGTRHARCSDKLESYRAGALLDAHKDAMAVVKAARGFIDVASPDTVGYDEIYEALANLPGDL